MYKTVAYVTVAVIHSGAQLTTNADSGDNVQLFSHNACDDGTGAEVVAGDVELLRDHIELPYDDSAVVEVDVVLAYRAVFIVVSCLVHKWCCN